MTDKYIKRDIVADPYGNPITGPNAFDLLPDADKPDWYKSTGKRPTIESARATTPEAESLILASSGRRKRRSPAQKSAEWAELLTKKWGKYRVEPYDPDAVDADNDGIVQEGTVWERPAGTRLVDRMGKELQKGMYRRSPSSDWKILDGDGNEVDYTPKASSAKRPKKGTIGEISRTASIGDTIGGTAKPAKKSARKPKKTPARQDVDAPHTLDDREDAVDSWVQGSMRKLRTFITDILNGPDSADDAKTNILKTVAGLEGPGLPLWANYTRGRRRTAILMNAVADGRITDRDLYRGEYSELGGRDLLKALTPGSEYGLPLRSFTSDSDTTNGIITNFQQPYTNAMVRDGTSVVIVLKKGAVSADLQDVAQAIKDETDEADPSMVKERAGEGVRFSQSEAMAWPFHVETDEMLQTEQEHLVMGNARIVSVEWRSPMGETIDEAKSDRNGTITIVLEQTETLGRPEQGGRWR